MYYIECSAKTGQNIKLAMAVLTKSIYNGVKDQDCKSLLLPSINSHPWYYEIVLFTLQSWIFTTKLSSICGGTCFIKKRKRFHSTIVSFDIQFYHERWRILIVVVNDFEVVVIKRWIFNIFKWNLRTFIIRSVLK